MKRKQKEPRRIRPVWETPDGLGKESPVSDSVCHEAEAKRLRFQPDETDSSEWKWNISDFRKEHLENSKEHLDDSNERSKDSNEHSNHLEELPNDSNEASNSSKECLNSLENSKECLKSSTDASEEPVKTSEGNEGSCKEYWESLKPELRNPPQVLRNQNQTFQGWKLPVRCLKEPSSYGNPQGPPSQLNANTAEKNEEDQNFRNEATNENMPVILNVFSLSKARQSNTKEENSVLFTPPCSPPYVQLGPFSATPVSYQKPRTRDGFINQAAFHQGRENWYKPVQQVYQNFHEYSSNPPQQVSSQNKPVKQVYYNYQEYLSYPAKQVSSQVYLNKPVQQVHSNFREIYPKPVQQVGSQEYLNRPVKQVYYNYQENWAYPVQQVNSHEYTNKPVQQVYCNPPAEYLSKPVQPEYLNHAVQPTTSPEYLSNPAQKVNPVNPQDYVYYPVQHNPQQIANGVLPLEKQIANQSMCERPPQANTAQLFTQGYHNYSDNNEQQTAPQLKSILTDSYLVERGNSMAKGNGIYARFKLKQPLAESNKVSHPPTEILPQFFQIPAVHDVGSGVLPTVSNHPNATNMFSNAPSTARSQNGVNSPPNYSTGVYTDKYRTDHGCSAILDGYGKNRVLSNSSHSPTNNNNVYSMKQYEDSFDTPTMISEKQSVYSEKPLCTSTIYIPPSSGVSGEPGTKNPHEFLSPRDAKVFELKQRLEEQEATLQKLRANH